MLRSKNKTFNAELVSKADRLDPAVREIYRKSCWHNNYVLSGMSNDDLLASSADQIESIGRRQRGSEEIPFKADDDFVSNVFWPLVRNNP